MSLNQPLSAIDSWPDNVGQAVRFAVKAHADQRYGHVPYLVHLDEVVHQLVVHDFGTDIDLVCAGYLHDVLEDTPVTIDELVASFGASVAELVEAVTSGPGPRYQRQAEIYRKIQAAGDRALALKLADRIANVERCCKYRDRRLSMYHREHTDFRLALEHPKPKDPRLRAMWATLNALL